MAPSPQGRTRRVLTPARRRRHVHGFALCTPAERPTGLVDHLVLTPAGPLLVHSVDHHLDDLAVARDAFCLVDRAAHAEEAIAEVGLAWAVEPVVVAWGQHPPTGSEGWVQHDTLFLPGRHLREWLRGEAARGRTMSSLDARVLRERLEARTAHRDRSAVA